MKKFFSTACTALASMILVFAILFTAVELVISDETFINNEFTVLGTSSQMGMSNTDLVKSTMRLVDYMKGNVKDINLEVTVNGEKTEMFELEQEVEHMKDVRQIYQTVKQYRDTGLLAMLLLFLLGAVVNFKKAPQMLAQGYLSGAFIMLLFIGFIGTWAALDFSSFWTFFHETLFWNNMWLFDANTSRMINMLPEKLFADMTGRIFLYAGIAIGALVLLSIATLVVTSDGHKQKKALREATKRARLHAKKQRAKQRMELKAAKEKEKRQKEKQKRLAAAQQAGKGGKKTPGQKGKKQARINPGALPPEKTVTTAVPQDAPATLPDGEEPAELQPAPRPLTQEEKLMKAAEAAILRAGAGIHLDEAAVSAPQQEPEKQQPVADREPTEEELQLMKVAEAAILRASGGETPERITSRRVKKQEPGVAGGDGAKGDQLDAPPVRIDSKTGRQIKEKRFGRLTFEFVQPDKKSSIQKKTKPRQPAAQPEDGDWMELALEQETASARTKRQPAPATEKFHSVSKAKKAPAKAAPKGPKKKRGNVEDDTGFLDD